MEDSFRSYYRPSEPEFSNLWEKGIFVLDTNILFDLYRYTSSVRDEFLKALQLISNRLWIPHQVALEYQHKRLDIISDQVGVYDSVRTAITTGFESIKNNLDRLQLKQRHSLINPDDFMGKLDTIIKEFGSQLDELRKKQLDVSDNDPIRARLGKLLKGRIGRAPESQAELDSMYKEADDRFRMKRPPGFADVDKGRRKPAPDSTEHVGGVNSEPGDSKNGLNEEMILFNGLIYKQKYADYVLWKQLLTHVESEKVKFVALITNEKKSKSDWLTIVKSAGDAKKTIGPRPELIQEMNNAGVSVFHIYNGGSFLDYSKSYLGAQVSKKAVDQVNDVEGLQLLDGEELRKCEWEKCNKTFIVKVNGISAARRFCSGTCRGRASEAWTPKLTTIRSG